MQPSPAFQPGMIPETPPAPANGANATYARRTKSRNIERHPVPYRR